MAFYSLLVPTRQRIMQVNRFLNSVKEKTKDLTQLEILFVCDEDDKPSINNINQQIEQYKDVIDIKLHTRQRTIYLNADYYNWLAERASGDFLWVLGDDVVIHENHWDVNVTEGLTTFCNKHKDRIVCASIKDNTPKPSHTLPKFPCFPMFSKEAFKVTGMLLHPKIPTWGADYVAYVTYNPIQRLLEFNDRTYLNHISYHTKQIKEDAVNIRIGRIFNQLKGVPIHNIQRIEKEELPEIRTKLENYIRNFKEE